MDLRDNKGCTLKVRKKLALSLIKNLELLKHNKEAIRASWFNLALIEVHDDKINEIMGSIDVINEGKLNESVAN